MGDLGKNKPFKEVHIVDLIRAEFEKLAKFDGVIDPNLHAWVVTVITSLHQNL